MVFRRRFIDNILALAGTFHACRTAIAVIVALFSAYCTEIHGHVLANDYTPTVKRASRLSTASIVSKGDHHMDCGQKDTALVYYMVVCNRFTYNYEQDTIRTQKLAYFWDGSTYAPSWGEGIVFDYDVPVEDLLFWPTSGLCHKVDENLTFFGNNGEWDWYSYKYYYSKVNGETTAIDAPHSVNTKTTIYNLQGMKVGASLQELPKGTYIVKNGNKTVKTMKR